MISALALGVSLLAAVPAGGSEPGPDDLAAYRKASEAVGRDPEAHVRLALWCEAHGLSAERVKHLTLAVLNRPEHALARGLLGLVSYGGKWQRPEAAGEKARADAARAAAVAQYQEQRAKAGENAEGQYALALWCDKAGLPGEARAHLQATLHYDSDHDGARKRLGYHKTKAGWVSEAESAAKKAEAEEQKAANTRWKPVLEGYRRDLASSDEAARARAEEGLSSVTDPRAVPTVWAVFAARPDADRQATAVRVLAGIDAAAASKALAVLAVSGRSAEVRRAAAETLRRRDPREFAGLLVGLVRAPVKYRVRDVGDRNTPGLLEVEGKAADLRRVYTPPPTTAILPTDRIAFDASGNPVLVRQILTQGIARRREDSPNTEIMIPVPGTGGSTPAGGENYVVTEEVDVTIPLGQVVGEQRAAGKAAEASLKRDVAAIEAANRATREANAPVLAVLSAVAGQNLGDDPPAWKQWHDDQIGFASAPQKYVDKPTITVQADFDYAPPPVTPSVVSVEVVGVRRLSHSCFGAGTLVTTLDGPRAIETLATGDLVLAQDTRTGALGYKPVVTAVKNPPSPTYRVSLDGGKESVVTSPFHRFWKAGQGWVMARDLQPGDVLRTVGGLTKVEAKDDDAVQPVYNLEVADSADFFVGRAGTLVHDITLPDLRVAPFDAAPALSRREP